MTPVDGLTLASLH